MTQKVKISWQANLLPTYLLTLFETLTLLAQHKLISSVAHLRTAHDTRLYVISLKILPLCLWIWSCFGGEDELAEDFSIKLDHTEEKQPDTEHGNHCYKALILCCMIFILANVF